MAATSALPETRSVIAVGCLAIGLIHLLDLQSKFHETPYLGWLYLALIGAAMVAAVGLLSSPERRWLRLGAATAGLPIAGYVLSRSIGLPAATGDIGNWLEPLGLASLFAEGTVLLLICVRLLAERRATAGKARAAGAAGTANGVVRSQGTSSQRMPVLPGHWAQR